MSKNRYIFIVVASILMIIFSIVSLLASYDLPDVGPVGDGKVDSERIITNFIWRMVGALAFLTIGIIGLYKNKKK